MSNNRMWLVNPQTGQRILLAKHMQSEWRVWSGAHKDDTLEIRLGEAFDAETKAGGLERKDERIPWRGTTSWRIEYEHEQSDEV